VIRQILDGTFYETYEDALLEDNALGTEFPANTTALNKLYARVENMNACWYQ
jgi:hypothetical protein